MAQLKASIAVCKVIRFDVVAFGAIGVVVIDSLTQTGGMPRSGNHDLTFPSPENNVLRSSRRGDKVSRQLKVEKQRHHGSIRPSAKSLRIGPSCYRPMRRCAEDRKGLRPSWSSLVPPLGSASFPPQGIVGQKPQWKYKARKQARCGSPVDNLHQKLGRSKTAKVFTCLSRGIVLI